MLYVCRQDQSRYCLPSIAKAACRVFKDRALLPVNFGAISFALKQLEGVYKATGLLVGVISQRLVRFVAERIVSCLWDACVATARLIMHKSSTVPWTPYLSRITVYCSVIISHRFQSSCQARHSCTTASSLVRHTVFSTSKYINAHTATFSIIAWREQSK